MKSRENVFSVINKLQLLSFYKTAIMLLLLITFPHMLDVFGSSILGILSPIFWLIPLTFGAFIFYYFVADKKRGEMIVNKIGHVAARFYAYIWMFIGSIVVFAGLNGSLGFILDKILPGNDSGIIPLRMKTELDYAIPPTPSPVSDDSSKTLVVGLMYIFLGIIIFGLHYWGVSRLENGVEKRGTVLNKMFGGLGLFLFSLLTILPILSFVNGFVDFLYDTDRGLDGSALATSIAAFILWLMYAAVMYGYLKVERRRK